jgi:putative ABC transport system permease protein
MLRNYVISALRNLERNRLYAAITILGLAVAFTAAILIGQFVRSELTYDHWIPGYKQVYKISNTLTQPDQPPSLGDSTPPVLTSQLKAVFPGAEAMARLAQDFPPIKARPGDDAATDRTLAWADPDIFKVLPLPALAGNLQTALQQPDTVVITRAAARRYFHRDLPIGETLLVRKAARPQQWNPQVSPNDWHAMRVTAVLKDLPSNTNLLTQVFASSRSAYSIQTFEDTGPVRYGALDVYTFVRLKPGVSQADLERALSIASAPEAAFVHNFSPGAKWVFGAIPLGEAHLTPVVAGAVIAASTASRAVVYGIAGVGALIVLVASINFVTLMTARAARRGVEVGVRKATGARRRDLMVQFVGETLIQVALATLIAAALAEALIKPFSSFLQKDLTLDFVHDPALTGAVALVALTVGLVAAVYPALVLSAFRPAAVLKGGVIQGSGSPAARTALVVVQFVVLVCLIATTVTVWRQTQYALFQGLGAKDSKLLAAVVAPCGGPFDLEARKLPGVAGAACSSYAALNMPASQSLTTVQLPGRAKTTFSVASVDFGFFELFGVKPVAGRVFQPGRGEDAVLRTDPMTATQPALVINETGARMLGFSDPRAAVGKTLNWQRELPNAPPPSGPPMLRPSKIVGVVPDIQASVRLPISPMLYYVDPKANFFVTLRLTDRNLPSTVKAVADTWKRTNKGEPFNQLILSQFRASMYLDLVIQQTTVAICAGLAVLIACLGLFALAAYTTERRTKEIGVRKAMGADTRAVVLLLLWQFTIPVLAATAVAIPLGVLAMDWWLRGFVYHTPLSAWVFVLAAASAVVIAWVTVSWQSFTVASSRPAGALRYE